MILGGNHIAKEEIAVCFTLIALWMFVYRLLYFNCIMAVCVPYVGLQSVVVSSWSYSHAFPESFYNGLSKIRETTVYFFL